MDNETTIPGLLTLPASLDTSGRSRPTPRLYKLTLVAAVLVLIVGLCCYFI